MADQSTGIRKSEQEEKIYEPQTGIRKEIAQHVWERFDRFRNDRNQSFHYFGNKTLLDYVSDSNALFNNYRLKPEWKEEWQANISDPTTHSKLMAIAAQLILSREMPRFGPRFDFDFYSKIKADLYKDIYDWTETAGIDEGARDGLIDDLFALIRAMRDGTVIAFEGYKKTRVFDGIDFQFVPLDDFYPGNIMKFHIEDQIECVWRSVMLESDFTERYPSSKWMDVNKVKTKGNITSEGLSFFNISQDLSQDEVEVLRYFNREADEFFVVANGILITPPDSKLSTRRKDKDKKPGFIKTVYEAYDDHFFYGRSLPNVQKDTQEAIDFLFNAMFDKEILSVMRPILLGQNNDLTEDYWYPGATAYVNDVMQVKELGFEGPDINAFRMLKELKDRQNLVLDPTQQGIALGARTATEVTEAAQAAQRIYALFNVMINSFRLQKARLRIGTIQQYLLHNKKFTPFLIHNTRLSSGKQGLRKIKITERISPRDEFGYSPVLAAENALIEGESEIVEIAASELENFSIKIKIDMLPESRFIRAYKKERFMAVALQRPDLYDQKTVGDMFAEEMGIEPDKVRKKEESEESIKGLLGGIEKTPPSFNPEIKPLRELINKQQGL